MIKSLILICYLHTLIHVHAIGQVVNQVDIYLNLVVALGTRPSSLNLIMVRFQTL